MHVLLPVCTSDPLGPRTITRGSATLLHRPNNGSAGRDPNGRSYGRMSVTNALRLARRFP